jgi:hypothetical protein
MPATATTAETWCFGIEIECYMPEGQAFDRGQYHHGLQVRPIDRWLAQGWTAERDGSVVSDRPGYVGVEIVSPKLSGEAGLTEVFCMIDWLSEIGAYVDAKCGQHVSVDARDLRMEQVAAIRETFKKLERGLFLANGERAAERWNSSYCVPMTSGRQAPAQRYWSLNLTNYTGARQERKRLEFRLWAGTLDAAKSVSYILASVGLVAGVAAGDEPRTVPADALDQLRLVGHQYIIGHRMLDADKVSDLTDICRDLIETGKAGREALARASR